MKKSSTKKLTLHSDTSTLDGALYILTVKNESKLETEGPLTVGSAVLCLRNDTGYYVPCVATVVRVTPSGRVTVDLYTNKSQRVTVTKKAILWEPKLPIKRPLGTKFRPSTFCFATWPPRIKLAQVNLPPAGNLDNPNPHTSKPKQFPNTLLPPSPATFLTPILFRLWQEKWSGL